MGRWRLSRRGEANGGGQPKKDAQDGLGSRRQTSPGFTVLKRRWGVERTLAWVMNSRRHVRDYEVLTRHSEALIQIAMIHLLLKRIK